MIYRKSTAGVGRGSRQADGIQESLERLKIEEAKGEDREVVLDVNKAKEEEGDGEAAQCIWLARVRPEDCENIIRYTVLQGKVVKPESQLRGGFDRCTQMVSW